FVALPGDRQLPPHARITRNARDGPARRRQHPALHLVRREHGFPHEPAGRVERAGKDDGGVRGGRDFQAAGGGVHDWFLVRWSDGARLSYDERATAPRLSSRRAASPALRTGPPSVDGTSRSRASPP